MFTFIDFWSISARLTVQFACLDSTHGTQEAGFGRPNRHPSAWGRFQSMGKLDDGDEEVVNLTDDFHEAGEIDRFGDVGVGM
jgi:hypothetical protein